MYFLHFCWSIVAYNVVLVSAIQHHESARHIHIPLCLGFPSHLGPHKPVRTVQFPVLYSRFSLAILYTEKAMAPTPALLPGKSHGRKGLVGCSPWGR